ncbi:MAG: bifunctional YncE family protein/alkaline phosphatase family protein [Gemmatimonadaceae bacterium]
MPHSSLRLTLLALCVAAGACGRHATPVSRDAQSPDDAHRRLPTGVSLDPDGRATPVGQMPLAMALSPDGSRIVLLLSGWREQGIQVVDRASGRVVQTLAQPSAFVGLAFAPDGHALYTSGGDGDLLYRYDWRGDTAVLADSVALGPHPAPGQEGVRYPAGLAFSPDGKLLYVAENLGDSLAVVDVSTGSVSQRLPSGRYPYGAAVTPNGEVYVSSWGASTVWAYAPANGTLAAADTIRVARHPSAMVANRDGSRLYVVSATTDRVVVIDAHRHAVVGELRDPPPAGPSEGSTPNALALSGDGARLFAAEADANAVAVFDLAHDSAGADSGRAALLGRIQVDWYPSAILAAGDTILVANGKGAGTAPNPGGPTPIRSAYRVPMQYTLGQLTGTLSTVVLPNASRGALAPLSARVSRANRWDEPASARGAGRYPPFTHVIYVIKENRTYDQVLGDLRQADGDTSLLFFPRPVSPNHHALAERFGIFDRFFTNAEVSAQGHNWSTGAYSSDYVEKTVTSNYSNRRPYYDYEGTNRDQLTDDDVASPSTGYLWNLAQRAGITFRNYGEFVVSNRELTNRNDLPESYRGDKPFLAAHTDSLYPGFDLDIEDQKRVDVWLDELRRYERTGDLPNLEIVRLPNDHTSGARVGAPTPRAAFADNDLALGRLVDGLSRSRFWRSTVVFVVEDDAQNGPDHVDSHRAPFFMISAYSHAGVVHRFVNTTDVIATIADILHLGSLSQFDYYGRPLRGLFTDTPYLTPYVAQTPAQRLDDRNPASGPGAKASARLNLELEDESDDNLFNHILWEAIKGPSVPYPGTTHRGMAKGVLTY